ncbi:MAG: hypothetical protein KC561_09170, partial [Myxococcales bacterium]|nr:hypothetical protein [Myxococcales bacterium]
RIAIAGLDYTAVSGTAQLGDLGGQIVTEVSIEVPILPDDIDEVDETVDFIIENPVNVNILGGTTTASIEDDDGPAITLHAVSILESDGVNPSRVVQIRAELSATSPQAIQLGWDVIPGTADEGDPENAFDPDYHYEGTGSAGLETIPAGASEYFLTFDIIDDDEDEIDETATVVITNTDSNRFSIADGEAVVEILDDDGPVLVVNDIQVNEGDSGTPTATFTVNLTNGSGQALASVQDVTLDWATVAGTATQGSDFTGASGQLTISAGQTSGTIEVNLISDTTDENDETFTLDISNVDNASPSSLSATATILDDDEPPTISVLDASLTEGNSGTANMTFTLQLSEFSGRPISVAYATSGGTATSGTDFQATSGTANIAMGPDVDDRLGADCGRPTRRGRRTVHSDLEQSELRHHRRRHGNRDDPRQRSSAQRVDLRRVSRGRQ